MSVRRVSVRRAGPSGAGAGRRGTTPPRIGRAAYEASLRRWSDVLQCCAAPDIQQAGLRTAHSVAVRAARDAALHEAAKWAQLAVEYALVVVSLSTVTHLPAAAVLALALLVSAYLAVSLAVEAPGPLARLLRWMGGARRARAARSPRAGPDATPPAAPRPPGRRPHTLTLVFGMTAWIAVAAAVNTLVRPVAGESPLDVLERVRSRLSTGRAAAPSGGLLPGWVGAAVLALALTVVLHVVLSVVVEVGVQQVQAHRRARDLVLGIADPMVSLLHLALPHVRVRPSEAVVATIDLLDTAASAIVARAARTPSWSTWHHLMGVAGRCRQVARDLDLPEPYPGAGRGADDVDEARDVAAELLIDVLREAPPFSTGSRDAVRPRHVAPGSPRRTGPRGLGTALPDVLAGVIALEALGLAGWDLRAAVPSRLALFAGGCGTVAVLVVEAACQLLPLRAAYHRDRLREWFVERVGPEAPIAERQLLLELEGPDVEGWSARPFLGGTLSAVLAQPASRLVARIGEVVAEAMASSRPVTPLVRAFTPGEPGPGTADGGAAPVPPPEAERQLRLSLLQLRGTLERGWHRRLRLASWLLSGGIGWVSLGRAHVPAAASSVYLTATVLAGGLVASVAHSRVTARAVPSDPLVDAAPPVHADQVIDLTTRQLALEEALRGPELVRYRGQLSWSVVPGGVRIAIAAEAVLPGGRVAVDVDGTQAEPVAPFAVLASGDGVDLRAHRATLDVPVDGRPVYADFTFDRPAPTDVGGALWLEVSQRGRFVTLAEIRLGRDGSGAR